MDSQKVKVALLVVLLVFSMAFSLSPFLTDEAMAGAQCGSPANCDYPPHLDWFRANVPGPDCCCVHTTDMVATCW